MFVHDFVVVRRPFGEVLARLPFLLESELAGLIHALGHPAASSIEAHEPQTVVIGLVRERLDAVVYPVAWRAVGNPALPGIEADIEISVIDESSCDLHLVGCCTGEGDMLSDLEARRRRREVVYAVRRLLEDMKRALETPTMYARSAAERTLARHGSSVRPTEKP